MKRRSNKPRLLLLAGASVIALLAAQEAPGSCVPPPSGLVAWWRGEGDAADVTGANSGTLLDGATFAPGETGQAFSLNGQAYVRLPDDLFPVPPKAPAGTPFSFETWFRTQTGGVILGQQAGVPYAYVDGWVPGIYVGTDGRLRTQVFWSGSASPAVSAQVVTNGGFHHVAVTFDGATETAYLDGQIMSNRALSQVSYANSYRYQLGVGYTASWPGGNGDWFPFQGLIDEAALYNRALSADEVAALYAAGAAGKCPDSLPPVVTQPPPSLDAAAGSTLTLTPGVIGAPPLAYQWQFYGTNLPDAANATLSLANLAATQGGPYSIFITNAFGAAQSQTGLVTVVFPLALDAVVTNGVPFAGAGNLESPGAQNVYTFTAPATRVVYLGVLSAFNRLFWSLTAPDGSAVFTGRYVPYDDVRRLELPMPGAYRLVVYNDSGLTGPYSFRVSAVTDQVFTLSPGDRVTNGVPAAGAGNLEMSGSQDTYLFTAPANGTIYLNVLSSFNRLFWSLTAPDGSAVFANHYMPYNDIGRVALPQAGTYRLRVFDDDQFTGTYSFQLLGVSDQVFNISVGHTVTNGVPAAGAGNLETPGTWDDYLFTAPPDGLVFFDALSSFSRLFWSLYAPDDAPVFASRSMPNNDIGRLALPLAGTYRLRVFNDQGLAGTYSFRLSGIADEAFTIAVGDTVTNGVPAAGAGNLEVPGAFDDYVFDASTNPVVDFQVLSAPFRVFWTLYAPDNSTVFSSRYMPNNDLGRVALPMAGAYRLRVYSDTDATGTYSFKLWNVVDQTFNLAVGATVTNGVPAAGAGNLEMPGAYDDYLFSAPTNRAVFFDGLFAPYRLFWTLFAPDGSTSFSRRYLPNNDVGRVDLPTAGTYRLRVYSDNGGTGPYSFRLSNVLDQSFAIAIGSVVTNGSPAAGAGVLESPGAEDLFTFAANAGQKVRFNDRDSSPRVATWRLVAPGGAQIFSDPLDGTDPGTFTLPAAGTYFLHVRNNSDQAPVNYSFALIDNGTTNVPPILADRFNLAIGDLVSNGVPALGAGNIETNGALDIYTFTSAVGQVVFFEDLGATPNGQLRYNVYDGQWTPLFGEQMFQDYPNHQAVGRQTLVRGGSYYIVASGNKGTTTGTYSFKLWPVADQTFALNLGDTVTTNRPGPGAGVLSTPGQHQVFTFIATPGQEVYFEALGATPNGGIRYDVYDDSSTWLFGEWLYQDYPNHQAVGRQTLVRGGAYRIVVSGYTDTTGAYSFKLWPVADQTFALNLGDTVTTNRPGPGAGVLSTPGQHQVFTFTATPGQEVYFEALGATPNGGIRYDVYDDRSTWLFGEWLYQDYGNHQAVGRQTLVRGGAYTIVVSGYTDATGTYAFKLWPGAEQSFALSLGDTVTTNTPAPGAGILSIPGARQFFTFMAAPGQEVYFEDLGATPTGGIRYDVYDDRATWLFGEWLYQDFGNHQAVGRQTLARGGAYTIVVSGYTDASGGYSFKLWPVADQSFALNLGDTVTTNRPGPGAGTLATPGVHQFYTFTVAPEQQVYFQDLGATPSSQIRYDVYDPDWNPLFGEWLNLNSEVGLRRLSRGGAYHLVASANADNTGTYSLRLWNALPQILEPPRSAHGLAGQGQSFTVGAESPFPVGYQWQFYGTNLPGATGSILTLASPSLSQAGPYSVIVSNTAGAVTSAVATLTLDAAEFFVSAFAPSGPVNTNVAQALVRFNSPVPAGGFTPAAVTITGPSGPLDPSTFNITPVDSQTFGIGFPAQSAEGAYTFTLGPAITNQAGVPMTGGALSPVYATDFESGPGGAWSRGETLSNAVSSRFLGEFADDTVTLFLAGLPPHGDLRLAWDTLIIGRWDGNLVAPPDLFGFDVTGRPQPAWEASFHTSGDPLVQSFPRGPDVAGVSFAGNPTPGSIYRNLQFDFPHTNDTLEVSFHGRNLVGLSYGGWGLDNVGVLAPAAADGTFTGRFVLDKTAPLVTNVSPGGTVSMPVTNIDVAFNEPIQPQSFTTNDVSFADPFGNAIPVVAPARLTAAGYRLTFASQRTNGTYTLVLRPPILDLAGNAMVNAVTNTFRMLTAPAILTPPQSLTVLRNNSAAFTVVAAATPPVAYQWTFNGAPIAGATDSTLTLENLQTNQAGVYRVIVTDAGGSTTSAPATLTVMETFGTFIPLAEAARTNVPTVPGNGVYIELYNGVGGSDVPWPSSVAGLTPSGTTLSPFIEFPNPGPTIDLGNTFDSFFATTTVPPDQVRGLKTSNFTLRIAFYLRVTRDLDLHPETPEIDLQLGVGSDDGFYLLAGTNLLGDAGPRGFTYNWMPVSFEKEGLYPVTLYYDDNGVGPLGLQFAWNTAATRGTNQIVPQSALYVSPNLGDRLITFEEVPAGTVLSNQYAGTGIVFTSVSGAVQVTMNFPTRFVPVSPPNVLADPNANPSQPGIVDLSFIAADGSPAVSDFVSFFMINAQNDVPTVTAFDSGGQVIFTNSYHGGGASQELVAINQPGIARVRLNLGSGTNTAAIDNLAFLTPISLPDLIVSSIMAPASAVAGQPVQLVWRVTNQGSHPAQGPWTDAVSLSTDGNPADAQPLASVTYSNLLAVGSSVTVTQSVILPASEAGTRWFVITADASHAFQEGGSLTSHTTVAPFATQILAPGLAVQSVSAPAAAHFGQTISVSWIVQNYGTAPASGPWHDLVLLSTNSASLANAIALLSAPSVAPLAPGASYTNLQTVTLPLNAAVNPGPYFLLVEANADGAVAEAKKGFRAAPISLTLPPLPDLAATNLLAPASVTPGATVTLSWAVTNVGSATASGVWTETALLSADGSLTNAQPLAVFTFTNMLNPGDGLTRTQDVVVPPSSPVGDVFFAVVVNSGGDVVEANSNNNWTVATNSTFLPAALTLQMPAQINENDPPTTGTVTRNGDLSQPLTVALSNSNPAHLLVPANVVIAAGLAAAPFQFSAIRDGVVDGPEFATIEARAPDFADGQAALTVNDSDVAALALQVALPVVPEGGTLTATVTRPAATTNDLTVFPGSSNPNHLTVPLTVVIPAGQASATFSLQAIDDGLISTGRTVQVTAGAAGMNDAPPVSVLVMDADVPAVQVTLAASTVSEGAGPQATTATVTRAPVSAQPVVVQMVSSNPAAARVPDLVTIPAGQASASFPVAAVEDHVVGNTRQTLITPYVTDSLTGAPVAAGTPALLTVLDDNGPTLMLSLARALVATGLSPATTGLVWRTNTDTSQALVVGLSSSDATHATVLASVTIPAGQVSVTFPVNSTTNGAPGVNYPVTISATAPGVTEGVATLVVGNVNLPDLVVASITAPTNAPTESYANISYRILNQGQAPTSGSFLTQVFLTQDPGNVTNPPAGAFTFAGSLAAGQSFDQALQVLLPVSAGDYWVVVSTDVGNAVPETLEDNNTLVSPTPIHVTAAYEATVSVDLHRAPSGTPVPFHGRAFRPDGTFAAQVPVDIFLTVRGTQRIILAQTDNGGNFTNAFLPLPNEGGLYQIGAAHPGDASAPVQDTFTLFGMKANPSSPTVTVVEQNSVTGSVAVVNLSDVPLSSLGVNVSSQMGNVAGSAGLSATALPGFATNVLSFVLTASEASTLQGTVDLKLTSAEGATLDVPLQVSVVPLRARVSAVPTTLLAGVKPGGQAVVEFDLANLGNTPTAPLSVVTPNLSWLHVAGTNPMPPLAPGATNRVTLQLTPAADLPLGPYNGALIVSGGDVNLSVPFGFRALSDAKGDLRVTTVDEYTFYAAGSPPLAGAGVTVKDSASGVLLTNGITDPNGQFVVPQLPEGYYDIDAAADKHIGFHGTTLVKAGLTNDAQAFLSRETVQYVWTVTPTEIPETFKIAIETTFETFVPIPVVTIEPALIDLSQINAEVTQINLRISNHGLVAANDFHLVFGSNSDWQFTPLVSDLGALPANSSLTVPLTIRRLTPFGPALRARRPPGLVHVPKDGGGGGCGLSAAGIWTLFCGTTKTYSTPIGIANGGGGCPGGIGGFGGGGTGGAGSPYVSTPFFSMPPNCNTNCKTLSIDWDASALLKPGVTILETVANAALAANLWTRTLGLKLKLTADAKGKAQTCCSGPPGLQVSGELTGKGALTIGKSLTIGKDNVTLPFTLGGVDGQLTYDAKLEAAATATPTISLTGSASGGCGKDPDSSVSLTFSVPIKTAIEGKANAKFTVGGIPKETSVGTLNIGLYGGISFTATYSKKDGLKTCYKSDGLYASDNFKVFGQSFDAFQFEPTPGKFYFIQPSTDCPGGLDAATVARLLPLMQALLEQTGGQQPEAVRSLLAQFGQSANVALAENATPGSAPAPQGPAGAVSAAHSSQRPPTGSPPGPTPQDAGGICADVRLRLDQDLVLTRSAFNATLQLINNDPANSLNQVAVQVDVFDSNGDSASDRFSILTNGLTGLDATDGTGVVQPGTTGTASWLVVPTPDAAPGGPTPYSVGGYLTYVQGSNSLTVPFTPVPITVYPDPQLHVKYFHQRDVYADDPFTPIVEPSIPFSLAVMIQNTGQGAAKNVSITSAQPKIIDNQKGLLIDFKIIGTQVAGQNVTPSLTVDFGTINPGQIAIGQWLLTSTLQGLFTDYSATLEHTGGPLDQQLSLIDEVSIHETIRLVEAPGAFEDGQPDFLVSESRVPPFDLPDTLYLSDGSTSSVQVVQESAVAGQLSANNLSVQLNASLPGGWTYLNVPDPGNGQFDLVRVVRSDGVEIYFNTNVWTTDRTFIGQGKAPIYEHKLHLLDYNSTGSYQLFYQMPHPADSIPPASQVAALPAQSFDEFPVMWSGQDNPGGSGLAYFDVYVSDNGGPFAPWVTQTTDTSDIYFGTLGHTYAFYSAATDNASNHEARHTTPDAQTTVSLVNQPATLDPIPDQTIRQGDTLRVVATGHDPDGEALAFSLVGNAPAGVQIDPVTGLITWITAGSTPPGTNQLTVQVLDNGIPREGMTRTFNVIVLSGANTPPVLAPIADRTLVEGDLLVITNTASDSDFPPQTLTFSLGPGAPTNATINPVTGLFQWQPTHTQTDSTNRISVIVTDNGTPSLSATQSFSVIVIRVLPDFVLSMGSTNLMVGETGVVPVTLASTLDLTGISFQLEARADRVTNLVLQPVGDEVVSATLQALGSNDYAGSFTLNPALRRAPVRAVGLLSFLAVTNAHSAIVPLILLPPVGQGQSGQTFTNTAGISGRAVVVGAEPVVDLFAGPTFTLYGHPGADYVLQSRTNITAAPWLNFSRLTLNGRFVQLTNLPSFGPMTFYRAYETPSFSLGLQKQGGGALTLISRGQPGVRYTLQSATNLAVPVFWSDLFSVTLTNNPQGFTWTNSGEPARYFRARQAP